MKVIKDQPTAGDCVLDVGAFDLINTLGYAELVGDSGFVHAIDPQLILFERSPLSTMALWTSALGSAKGQAHMGLPDGRRPDDDGPFDELEMAPSGIEVTVETLDNIAYNLKRCDFVRMDVNGFEPFVLMGGAATLLRLRPTLLIRNDPDKLTHYGLAPINLIALLETLRYKVYPRPLHADPALPHDLLCDPLPL
jgi:FkbM family methyltransferase